MVRKGGAPKMNQLTLRRFTHKWVFEYHPTLRINMDGSMFLRLGRKTTKYGGEGWIMLRNTYDIGRVERGTTSRMLHSKGLSQVFEGRRNQMGKPAAWKSWTIRGIFVKAPMQFTTVSAAGF